MKITRRTMKRIALPVLAGLVVLGAMQSALYLAGRQRVAHAASNSPTLLLIQCYQDTCNAFDTLEPAAATTFFAQHVWHTHIRKVAYYLPNNEGIGCADATTYDTPGCHQLAGTDSYLNDHILHLACMVAWYIYHNFTEQSIPVYVLAHSMGGLIIRDAIGESRPNNAP